MLEKRWQFEVNPQNFEMFERWLHVEFANMVWDSSWQLILGWPSLQQKNRSHSQIVAHLFHPQLAVAHEVLVLGHQAGIPCQAPAQISWILLHHGGKGLPLVLAAKIDGAGSPLLQGQMSR